MTQWMIETLIASTALMGAVLMIRRPVANAFGPRVAYLLWLAPALRMVMPPLPAEWFGQPAIVPVMGPAAGEPFAAMASARAGPAEAVAPMAAQMDWAGLLIAFWVAGAIIFFLNHVMAYRDFVRRARDRATPLMDAEGVPVIASPLAGSPVALGIARRTILVPVDFLWRYDPVERRLAIAHELVHHRRRDLAANLAGLAILAMHWWNPVAHLAYRAFRLDQEAACDAVVLEGSDAGERQAYGNALYKSAAGRTPLALCALGSTSQLKARLRWIARGSRTAMPFRAVAVALLLVGAGVVMTASTIGVAAPVTPDARQPAMLALGGVEINTDAPEVKAARAKADAAQAAADRAAAKARISQITADAAMIEADAARIEAEASSDAARTAADAAREAARDAADAARADARRALATGGRCRDGTRMSADASDKSRDTMRIVMCGKLINEQAKLRDAVVAGLREAHDEVAQNRDIPDRIRESILASLNRQLAQWRGGVPTRPDSPAPPAAPRTPDGAEPPAPPSPPAVSSACPSGTWHTHIISRSRDGQSVTRVTCDGLTVVARVTR